MRIGMMDEDLQRVLLFLVDTLSKCPGWAHQGMLKQELLAAPMDGCLHRMLGSSSAETFADFLKCFPSIFCVSSNSNQLVQLHVKNGNVSDASTMNLIGNEGISLMKQEECNLGGGGSGVMPSLGILPVGVRKPLDLPHQMEWNSPMAVAPESSSSGASGKMSGFMCRDQNMPMAPLCGIPANYATRAPTLHAHRGNGGGGSSGGGSGMSGWDPVAHSLPDLQQSFLDSPMSHNSSIGHLANGWDRPVRPTTVPNCQMRYDVRGDTRYNHQRYSWDAGNIAPHSLTESLKNFAISDDNGYTPSPPPPSFGNATATIEAPTRNRWMSYSSLGCADSLDGFANNHAAGDSRFLRPMPSVWDDAMRSTVSPPSPPVTQPPPPPPQSAYLNRDANPLAMMNSHVSSSSSFKGWNEEEENYSGFPLGSSAKPSPQQHQHQQQQQQQQQQYYKWKSSSSPSNAVEAPLPSYPSPEVLLEEKNLVESEVEPIVKTAMSPLENILTPPTLTRPVVEEEVERDEEEEEEVVKSDVGHVSATKSIEGMSPSVGDTPPSKCGTMLSYAEALRSNTQRRRTGSESGLPSSSNQSSILTAVSSLKSPAGSCSERSSKCRRSLDGRCGKVETLNCGDGVLRLGNGKVYFERSVFYDSGKQVADLRNVLKMNDTVYFDATPDGSNHHEWKATLAWVGKKPRSASSSSPTVTISSSSGGRGTYRSLSEGNHPNSTTSNGVRSSSGNHSSVKESTSSLTTTSTSLESTVEGNGEVVILFAHFGFIRRGKKFKENVHFNRNVFYASGNRVKELTDTLKEGNTVNYIAVPSDKKSCKWKAVLVWTGPRPKV